MTDVFSGVIKATPAFGSTAPPFPEIDVYECSKGSK